MLKSDEIVLLENLAHASKSFARQNNYTTTADAGGFELLIDRFRHPSDEGVRFLEALCLTIGRAHREGDDHTKNNAIETESLLVQLAARYPGVMENMKKVKSNSWKNSSSSNEILQANALRISIHVGKIVRKAQDLIPPKVNIEDLDVEVFGMGKLELSPTVVVSSNTSKQVIFQDAESKEAGDNTQKNLMKRK